MFSDPFSNLMLVMLLFFCGLLVMFIFMMRNLESHWRNHEETRMQLSLHLSDLETKLDTLLRLAGAGSAGALADEPDFAGSTEDLLEFSVAAGPGGSESPLGGAPLYEQAVAPAWAGAQEYDSVSAQRELQPEEAAAGGLDASLPDFLERAVADKNAKPDDRPAGERTLDPDYR